MGEASDGEGFSAVEGVPFPRFEFLLLHAQSCHTDLLCTFFGFTFVAFLNLSHEQLCNQHVFVWRR